MIRDVVLKTLLALGVFSVMAAPLSGAAEIAGREASSPDSSLPNSSPVAAAPVNSAGALQISPAEAEPTTVQALSALFGGVVRLGAYAGNLDLSPATGAPRSNAVSQQYRCLATAVYFEARGETRDGQRAIAHVVLNRLKDPRFPDSICGVVYQNHNQPNRCQFSFACDGVSNKPRNTVAWRRALRVALETLAGTNDDLTKDSTHFHAAYVEPQWATQLKPTVKVGQHVFYQELQTTPTRVAFNQAK